MYKSNRHIMMVVSAAADAVLVFLSYAFSSWLWLDVLAENPNMASVSGIGKAALMYAGLIVLLYALFHLYGTSRLRSVGAQALVIAECNLFGILVVAAALFVFRLEEFSRGVLFMFFIISTLTVCLKHIISRWALARMRRNGHYLKHVILVGGGELARRYINDIRESKQYDIHLDGIIASAPIDGCGYLGELDQLEKYIHDSGVDSVVVALEPEEIGSIKHIIGICERNGTKVSVIPFYSDIIPDRPTIEVIGSSKLINLRSMPLDNIGYAFIKRAFDIAASAIGLIIVSPIMLTAVIGTKLSSPGPILFKQQRVGKDKRPFMMLKFRSMVVNSGENTAWTQTGDPRKTKFGALMRKLSIDELPQLINVLRGDMSLVGPRPEIPFFVEQFRLTIPLYMVKHQVRPGMTGWAQIHGYRGDTSILERTRCDIWYIENWSIGLDLRILARTFLGGWINHEEEAPRKTDSSSESKTNRTAV